METRYYLNKIIGAGDGTGKNPYRPVINDLIPLVGWSACDLRIIGNEPQGFMIVKAEGTLDDHNRIKKLAGCIEIGKLLGDSITTGLKTNLSNFIGRVVVGSNVRDVCKSIAELNPKLKDVKIFNEI